jgi:ATP-dependent Clp protease ATP-binding subunit ClpC
MLLERIIRLKKRLFHYRDYLLRENRLLDRFTRRSQKVLTLAMEEARKTHGEFLATEHLLIGLLAEGSGVAARVLMERGIELAKVRKLVDEIVPVAFDRVNKGPNELFLTPSAQRVVENSCQEAARFGQKFIGTEHLLLGC